MEDLNNTFILNTKLQIPNLPSDYIYRKHLIDYLNKDINRPLTLISAGAGYGKSSFVSSWVKIISQKSCWFSIDESDNDIRTFLSYFIAAIQTQTDSIGKNINRYLFSPNINSLEILTKNLIRDLNSLDEKIILVLDDFQKINNLDITNLLSNILIHPPKNFHLVIISRIDPPLPLARFRAKNKMKDIRSLHLKLNNNEIKEFLQNSIKTKDIEKLITLFNDKFEGWITGIRLLKIHLSYSKYNETEIIQLVENSHISESYFIDELIKKLDKETINFLLKTSLFSKFNTSLSDYALSTSSKKFESLNIINNLLIKNLFLINLDNNNEWFRYHHLFQDALKKEHKKVLGKEETNQIHKKAIEWYCEHNLFEDAFYHATLTNSIDDIVEFVRTNMYIPLNTNKWFILENWLNHIPNNTINNCPKLLTAQMWVMQHKNNFEIIPSLIEKVENIKENNIILYKEIEAQLVFFKGVVNFWTLNVEESVKQFNYARNNTNPDQLGAKSLSSIYYVIASQMMGNGDEVFKEIQLEISIGNLDIDYKLIILGSLIYNKVLEGDLYTAERITIQLKKECSSINNAFYTTWYQYFIGYIAFQQNKQKEALAHFREAIKHAHLLNTHGPIDIFAAMLLSLKLTNNESEYKDVYDQLTSFVHEWNIPTYNTVALSLKARLALLENNITKASKFIKMMDLSYDRGNIVFNPDVPRITYNKYLLAKGSKQNIKKAIDNLEEVLKFVREIHNIPQIIEVLINLSVAYSKNNNSNKAIDYITEALVYAERGHFIYPFIEQYKIIKPILEKIKTKDENINEFIAIISKSIALKSNNNNNHKQESLSNRELDILDLLAQRLSNKEIADMLFISTATVKRHTINIYQKMGVNKRQDAVRKAIEANIIKQEV
jgi:LuxR family maltose regulon positive regulatory protein